MFHMVYFRDLIAAGTTLSLNLFPTCPKNRKNRDSYDFPILTIITILTTLITLIGRTVDCS